MGQAYRVGDAEKGHVIFLEPFRDRTKKPSMEASGDRTNEGVELRVVHKTIWVIDLHDFWVLQNELVSDRSSSRNWTTRCFVGLTLTQNISTACASGIRDWQDHVRADQSRKLSNDQMADRRPLRRWSSLL